MNQDRCTAVDRYIDDRLLVGHYPEYVEWAIKLSRPGGLIVADNVVRDGAVIDGESMDPDRRSLRLILMSGVQRRSGWSSVSHL